MGSSSNSAKSDTADAKSFKINLFPDSGGFMKSDGSKGNDDENSNYIMIDIDGTADSKTFDRYMEDLDLKEPQGGDRAGSKNDAEEDDLLALMDSCK